MNKKPGVLSHAAKRAGREGLSVGVNDSVPSFFKPEQFLFIENNTFSKKSALAAAPRFTGPLITLAHSQLPLEPKGMIKTASAGWRVSDSAVAADFNQPLIEKL